MAQDWDSGGVEAAFLAQVHDAACRRFGTVLGPDYNAVHADHFHLQMGGFGICR
ncbi:MAG TPA: extensin family protein [Kiloniellaceae bacterium]